MASKAVIRALTSRITASATCPPPAADQIHAKAHLRKTFELPSPLEFEPRDGHLKAP